MKKIVIFIFIYIGIGILAFSLFKISNKYELKIILNNLECKVAFKGCSGARAIATDKYEGIFIGYKDYIKVIDNEGKEKLIYSERGEDIEDIVYMDSNIYFIENDSIKRLSVINGISETLRVGIPKGGNKIRRKLLVKEDKIYLSIGAISNSGIKEDGSLELIPIEKDELGNGAIYEIDTRENKMRLFATGIRGITGMDLNSKGEIIGIFSGMKNEGNRPINRDKDYIYIIEKDVSYGWPDYSGGDPINSPRFKGEKLVEPLIEKLPLRIVKAPLFQSEYVDSLREMSIDRAGKILPEESILFWNRDEQKLCSLSKDNILYDILQLNKDSEIEDIIQSEDGFYILDEGLGCIYELQPKKGFFKYELPTIVWGFLGGLIAISLGVIIKKACFKYKR
jgi:hypothetical protein